MSESTPTTETTRKAHLQPVPEEAPTPAPAKGGPVRQAGGHMTGLLALLLAVSMFAFLSQFSTNQQLQAQNEELQAALAGSQAELAASQDQMSTARDALGGLKDVLARIEGLLLPPSPVGASGEAAADANAEGAAAPE